MATKWLVSIGHENTSIYCDEPEEVYAVLADAAKKGNKAIVYTAKTHQYVGQLKNIGSNQPMIFSPAPREAFEDEGFNNKLNTKDYLRMYNNMARKITENIPALGMSTPSTINVNFNYDSATNEKNLTVTAKNAAAEELAAILKLSGQSEIPHNDMVGCSSCGTRYSGVTCPECAPKSAVVVGEAIGNEDEDDDMACEHCGENHDEGDCTAELDEKPKKSVAEAFSEFPQELYDAEAERNSMYCDQCGGYHNGLCPPKQRDDLCRRCGKNETENVDDYCETCHELGFGDDELQDQFNESANDDLELDPIEVEIAQSEPASKRAYTQDEMDDAMINAHRERQEQEEIQSAVDSWEDNFNRLWKTTNESSESEYNSLSNSPTDCIVCGSSLDPNENYNGNNYDTRNGVCNNCIADNPEYSYDCENCATPTFNKNHRGAQKEKLCADCYKYTHDDAPINGDESEFREQDDFETYNQNEADDYRDEFFESKLNESNGYYIAGEIKIEQGIWHDRYVYEVSPNEYEWVKTVREATIFDDLREAKYVATTIKNIPRSARVLINIKIKPVSNQRSWLDPLVAKYGIDEGTKMNESLTPKRENTGLNAAPKTWQNESKMNEATGYYVEVFMAETPYKPDYLIYNPSKAPMETLWLTYSKKNATIFDDLGEAKAKASEFKTEYEDIVSVNVKPVLSGPQVVKRVGESSTNKGKEEKLGRCYNCGVEAAKNGKTPSRVICDKCANSIRESKEDINMNESLTPKRENTGMNGAPRTWQNEPNEQIAHWRAVVDDSQGLSRPQDMFTTAKGNDNPMKVADNKKDEKLHEDATINELATKLRNKFNFLSLTEANCKTCEDSGKVDGEDCSDCSDKKTVKESFNRVRVGSTYRYAPVLIDIADAKTDLKDGDIVKVINLPGSPRANTMGHCYVGDPTTGKFLGLVHCNSLQPLSESKTDDSIDRLTCCKCGKNTSKFNCRCGHKLCSSCEEAPRNKKKSVKEGTLKEDFCVSCDKRIPSGSDIDQCKKCYAKDHPKENKKVTESTVVKLRDVGNGCTHVIANRKNLGSVWPDGNGSWAAEDNKNGGSWDCIDSKEEAIDMLLKDNGVSTVAKKVIESEEGKKLKKNPGLCPFCGSKNTRWRSAEGNAKCDSCGEKNFDDRLKDKESKLKESEETENECDNCGAPTQHNATLCAACKKNERKSPKFKWGPYWKNQKQIGESKSSYMDHAKRAMDEAEKEMNRVFANRSASDKEKDAATEDYEDAVESYRDAKAQKSASLNRSVEESINKSKVKKLQGMVDSLGKRVKNLSAPPSPQTKITQSLERFKTKIEAMKSTLDKKKDENKPEKDDTDKKDKKKEPSFKKESSKQKAPDEGKEAEPKPKGQKATKSDKPDTNGGNSAPTGKVKDIGKGIYEGKRRYEEHGEDHCDGENCLNAAVHEYPNGTLFCQACNNKFKKGKISDINGLYVEKNNIKESHISRQNRDIVKSYEIASDKTLKVIIYDQRGDVLVRFKLIRHGGPYADESPMPTYKDFNDIDKAREYGKKTYGFDILKASNVLSGK